MLMRTENTVEGPSEHKEGFGAGNILKFTAFWSTVKRGESFIQTQMFCGREALSQCGETGMVVRANEAGPRQRQPQVQATSGHVLKGASGRQLLPAERRLDRPWNTAVTLSD